MIKDNWTRASSLTGVTRVQRSPRLNSISDVIGLMKDDKTRESLSRMYAHFKERMEEAPAGAKHHHHWPGGYAQHVREVMISAVMIYKGLCQIKPFFNVTLDDIIIVTFLHDLEKVETYILREDPPATDRQINYIKDFVKRGELQSPCYESLSKSEASHLISIAKGEDSGIRQWFSYDSKRPEMEETAWVAIQASKFDLYLSNEQLSALAWSHGGWSKIAQGHHPARNMSALAAIVHSADLLSSKLWGSNVPEEFSTI